MAYRKNIVDWEEQHHKFSLIMENNDSTVPPWLWRHSHVSFLLLPFPNTLNNMNDTHSYTVSEWMLKKL